ncbi:hypothetical protein [uncultured Campylobacter sp.]|uniref:hypothetical protein n=1 Tax=uncultured Campylobacter sp. TaxID=218934 RepID=UPI0025D11B06|nr:hypothetical protein [uncultured Campylobacter sp.]
MKFYLTLTNNSYDDAEFQFPTGWNSTPNPKPISASKRGFNSQRDGILQDNLTQK